MTEEVKKEVERTNGELDEIRTKLKELKAALYAKFGTQINLDEDGL